MTTRKTNKARRISRKMPQAPNLLSGVDVVWTFQKRQDLADELRRRVRLLAGQDQSPAEDRQPSVRTTAKAAVPKLVADRLGEAAMRELIEARRTGAKLRELVDKYGISESSVKRLLLANRAHVAPLSRE